MTKEERKGYMSEYEKTEKRRAYKREYAKTPAGKRITKRYTSSPEYKERNRKRMAEYAITPKGRMSSYKKGAKQRGIEFSLTPEQFDMFWGKPCHYCGGDITTVGLDRVDNSIGYTMGNVVSCCGDCNAMKLTKSKEEFIKKCIAIAKRMDG